MVPKLALVEYISSCVPSEFAMLPNTKRSESIVTSYACKTETWVRVTKAEICISIRSDKTYSIVYIVNRAPAQPVE